MGDEHNGIFQLRLEGSSLWFTVVATDNNGWDHVSVSTTERCPRWNEMEQIKRMFFKDDEVAIQIHPPLKEYVNVHPYCLHLWRPIHGQIIMPPKESV